LADRAPAFAARASAGDALRLPAGAVDRGASYRAETAASQSRVRQAGRQAHLLHGEDRHVLALIDQIFRHTAVDGTVAPDR